LVTLLSLYFNLRQWHTRKLQGKEVQGALLGLWYLCRAALRSADNTHDNNDEPRLKEFAWQIANQVRHLEWGIDKLMVDIGFPLPLEMPETLRPSVPTEKTTEIVREGGRALHPAHHAPTLAHPVLTQAQRAPTLAHPVLTQAQRAPTPAHRCKPAECRSCIRATLEERRNDNV